jgi:hypothetical protein
MVADLRTQGLSRSGRRLCRCLLPAVQDSRGAAPLDLSLPRKHQALAKATFGIKRCDAAQIGFLWSETCVRSKSRPGPSG